MSYTKPTLEQRDQHIKAVMESVAARPDNRSASGHGAGNPVEATEDLLVALLWAIVRNLHHAKGPFEEWEFDGHVAPYLEEAGFKVPGGVN